MKVTAAQEGLIAFLIAEAIRDSEDLEHRWAKAASCAREYADKKQLLLVRHWTEDAVLSSEGEVWIVDTEFGGVPRLATDDERHMSLFVAIRTYPELLSLLPPRPPDAIVCSGCLGTGVALAAIANPAFRNVICSCGGAGWKPAHLSAAIPGGPPNPALQPPPQSRRG